MWDYTVVCLYRESIRKDRCWERDEVFSSNNLIVFPFDVVKSQCEWEAKKIVYTLWFVFPSLPCLCLLYKVCIHGENGEW